MEIRPGRPTNEPMPISRRSPGLDLQRHSAFELAGANFGAAQILQNRDFLRDRLRGAANQTDRLFVCMCVAMREIQPKHVDTGPDQGLDGCEIVRSGPERCNDFGVPHRASLQFLCHDH